MAGKPLCQDRELGRRVNATPRLSPFASDHSPSLLHGALHRCRAGVVVGQRWDDADGVVHAKFFRGCCHKDAPFLKQCRLPRGVSTLLSEVAKLIAPKGAVGWSEVHVLG